MTERFDQNANLLSFPFYAWQHIVIVPSDHPLDRKADVTLDDVAEHPIITYDTGVTGRARVDAAFDAKGLRPQFAMTALDADVIKAYVALGLGVGIIAPMAFDAGRDSGLRKVRIHDAFEESTTHIVLRRNRLHRSFVYRFIELAAPTVTEKVVRKADADTVDHDD